MEFRHLEYFLAVCEHPSITKAAESLYISQQALSRCIQGLETEFGCRLFKRTAQGSSLTDEGRYLYERFRPLSESYHQMAAEVTKHLQGLKKTITFASAPTIVSMLFPEVLYSFREKYPAFELEEQDLPDWSVIQYVLDDASRLGLIARPEQWSDERLQFIQILTGKLHLCVHKDNPLAARDSVAFADLKDQRFLMMDRGSLYRTIIETKAKECGFEPKIAYESADIHQLCSLVNTGRGIFLAMPVDAHGMFKNMRLVPFSDPDMLLHICFICQNFDRLEPQTRKFLEFLRAFSKEA